MRGQRHTLEQLPFAMRRSWTHTTTSKQLLKPPSSFAGSSHRHIARGAVQGKRTLLAQATTDRLLLVVGVALIKQEEGVDGARRVLLAQRPPGKANAHRWEFPGGKVDDGETPEGALVRELQEELGVTVQAGDLTPLNFVSFRYPAFHLLMPLYACSRWTGQPQGLEGQATRWVDAEQLQREVDLLTPADVPLVPDVVRALLQGVRPP